MKKMFFALTMWLTLTLLIIGSSTRAAAQATPTPSAANLRAMEQQIFAEVNKIRTNPAALAAALTTMNQIMRPLPTPQPEFLSTLPDSTTTQFIGGYLASAISTAQNLQPMGALVWSPGLAQAALNYANSDPDGHDDGSTMQSRLAAVGVPFGSSAESINYGGSTALLQTYELYIDSGVPNVGHRMMMIDPKNTHLGVGCYYPNQKYKNITCVLNYADNWTEMSDLVKPEIGKQYAYREKNGTFRYFVLTSTTGGATSPYRISLCPYHIDPLDRRQTKQYSGNIDLPNLAGLTTVANAARENLVAMNQPCSTDGTPQGVLNNGTAFPVAGSAVPGAVQAPAAPAAAQGPAPQPVVKDGEQFAVIQTPGSTFAYFKVNGLRVRGTIGPNTPIPVTRCPEMTSTGTTYIEDMMSVEVALARGLTATNEPCPNTPYGQ